MAPWTPPLKSAVRWTEAARGCSLQYSEDYADIAAAAAELDLDEAIDMISRIAGQARIAVSTGGQWPSTSMGTSGSSEAP